MNAPLRLRRAPAGGWTTLGPPLPIGAEEAARMMDASAIDPAGTAFLLTDRSTVLRVTVEGAVDELGLAPSCLASPAPELDGGEPEGPEDSPDAETKIDRLVSPFPDDVWVTVSRGSRSAVCRAVLTELRDPIPRR